MKKDIHINGINCSSLLAQKGYSVSYVKVEGDNGGTMLDGSTMVDILAIKRVLTVNLFPAPEPWVAALVESVYSADYVSVMFYDIRTGAYDESVFRYNADEFSHLLTNAENSDIWSIPTLTFEER